MTDQSNLPAQLRSLREIVNEYEAKRDAAADTVRQFKDAVQTVENASTIGGTYAGTVWGRGSPSVYERSITETLRKSAWRHVYDGLNIDKVAPAKDRDRFQTSFENPPEFTLDNIRATFGDYLQNPRFHILRGLAEVFCDLDPAYKSHSKVKIGVDGLPKRVILSGFGEYSYGSHGQNKLRDVLNALANYNGTEQVHSGHINEMVREARKNGSVMWWGGELKVYMNGNGHLSFDKDALLLINRALAEFYGEVLPDAPSDEPDIERDLFRSREVSKDLAYYPTPRKVFDEIAHDFDCRNVERILEPSCGDGRMMDALREKFPTARMVGIEAHAERADEARAKRHNVRTGNFLTVAPEPVFDLIVMNPPFYGKHWQKHIMHARKFLKPTPEGQRWGGGRLYCILPATAFYDGHLGDLGLIPKDAHTKTRGWIDSGWGDLPVASFSESGTNVPTGYVNIGPDQ